MKTKLMNTLDGVVTVALVVILMSGVTETMQTNTAAAWVEFFQIAAKLVCFFLVYFVLSLLVQEVIKTREQAKKLHIESMKAYETQLAAYRQAIVSYENLIKEHTATPSDAHKPYERTSPMQGLAYNGLVRD